MKRTLIAVTLAVLGFGATAAFANPTLDTSPNSMWRQAPGATAAEPRFEPKRATATFEQDTAEATHP
jgi:hypothetical protein